MLEFFKDMDEKELKDIDLEDIKTDMRNRKKKLNKLGISPDLPDNDPDDFSSANFPNENGDAKEGEVPKDEPYSVIDLV